MIRILLISLLCLCTLFLSTVIQTHIDKTLIATNKLLLFLYFGSILICFGYNIRSLLRTSPSVLSWLFGSLLSIIIFSFIAGISFFCWQKQGENFFEFIKLPFSNILFFLLPACAAISLLITQKVVQGKPYFHLSYIFSTLMFFIFIGVGGCIYLLKPKNLHWEMQNIFQFLIILFCLGIAPWFISMNVVWKRLPKSETVAKKMNILQFGIGSLLMILMSLAITYS